MPIYHLFKNVDNKWNKAMTENNLEYTEACKGTIRVTPDESYI